MTNDDVYDSLSHTLKYSQKTAIMEKSSKHLIIAITCTALIILPMTRCSKAASSAMRRIPGNGR